MNIHFGCLGNGTTCYDVDRVVNNDYPIVAHISNGGNVRWREENCKTMTPEERELIEKYAAKMREKTRTHIKSIVNSVEVRELCRLLDSLPWSAQEKIIEQAKADKSSLRFTIVQNIEEILDNLQKLFSLKLFSVYRKAVTLHEISNT